MPKKKTDERPVRVGLKPLEGEDLQRFLDLDPPSGAIYRESSYEYLKVSQVDADLDRAFGIGGWSWTSRDVVSWGQIGTRDKVKRNKLTGEDEIYPEPIIVVALSGTLSVRIDGVWIERSGHASTFASSGVAKTVSSAINSLARKNAAKTLGRRFGRELNRDFESPTYRAELYDSTVELIAEMSDPQELIRLATSETYLPEEIKDIARKKYRELTRELKSGEEARDV